MNQPTAPATRPTVNVQGPHGPVPAPADWAELVHSHLVDEGDYLTVDLGDECAFVQAQVTDTGNALEYRDGDGAPVFHTDAATPAEVVTAFTQWVRGDRDFVTQHTWDRIDLDD